MSDSPRTFELDGDDALSPEIQSYLDRLADPSQIHTKHLDERLDAIKKLATLRIRNLDDKAAAEVGGQQCQQFINDAKSWFEGPVKRWKAIYDAFAGKRKSYVDVAEASKNHLKAEIARYLAELRKMEAEAEAKRRAEEQERLLREAEQKALEEEFDLGLDEDTPPTGPPTPAQQAADLAAMFEPPVEMPKVSALGIARQSISGAKAGAKETYEPEIDMETLVLACAERLQKGDNSLMPYIQANEKAIKAALKIHGANISEHIPGVKAVIRDKVTFRA